MVREDLLSLVGAQTGHFVLECGYHTDEWWDLEALCQRPISLMPFVEALAERVKEYDPEVVCGPLVEGTFIGLLVASQMGCGFVYASRLPGESEGLFPVSYQVPGALRPVVAGKRAFVVNDVISAGSAVRGAIEDLRQLGATILGVGSLFVLGETFDKFCEQHKLPLIAYCALAVLQTAKIWKSNFQA